MFHGSMVALITPMHDNDKTVDFISLSQLIEWHINNQTQALVMLGTTGEAATINFAEREEILSKVVKQVAGRIPVIAGTGSNSTAESIQLTRHAMEMGVDACLIVTPYYNKPTQEGLYQHFKTIAAAVPVPQILYNVPSRTGCDLLPETVARLSEIPNIVGLKEATGDISRARTLLGICGNSIDLFSGDDLSACDFMLSGGKGVISVTANVVPRQMHDMCMEAIANQVDEAKLLQQKLQQLHKSLFVESNPIPVKWVLYEMGKIESGIRLPLTPLASVHYESVRNAMESVGIQNVALVER